MNVLTYRDPVGTTPPRMKVQIKNRESMASVQEMLQLFGLLQKEGDVGIHTSPGRVFAPGLGEGST